MELNRRAFLAVGAVSASQSAAQTTVGVTAAGAAAGPAQQTVAQGQPPEPPASGTIEERYSKYKPAGAYLRLSNETFVVDMDRLSGTLKGLYRKGDPLETNFLGNEMNQRVDVVWKKGPVTERAKRIPRMCWTGDVLVMHRGTATENWYAGHTNFSEDTRTVASEHNTLTVTNQRNSANEGGIRDLTLRQQYTLQGDSLIWRIELVNTSDQELEIGALGLPIVLNDNTAMGSFEHGLNHRSPDTVKEAYERRVFGHMSTSGHSSYFYATRPSGQTPSLLALPIEDTLFEINVADFYRNWFKESNLKTKLIENKGPVIYLCSEAVREVNGWKPWINGHRTFRLAPGGRKAFALALSWVQGDSDLQEKRFEQGQVVAEVTPGMVLPRQVSANLLLRCRQPITGIQPEPGLEIQPLGQKGDRYTYRVRLAKLGELKASVQYGNGQWTNLLFYGTEDLETLMKKRAQHMAAREQITDPADVRRYGFVMWNNVTDTHVARDPVENNDVSIGGSDESGLNQPMFLSEKNVYYPDPKELRVLDDFVEKFLYGRLQDPKTFEVKNNMFGPRPGTWRRWDIVYRYYNYSHVYNIYYNMCRIARRHQATKTPAIEYLRRAYRTALVAYQDSTYAGVVEHKNFMDYYEGNMSRSHAAIGMWNLANILRSLEDEGMADASRELSREMKNAWSFWFQEEYPLATEYCFDGAAFEPTYYVARLSGNQELADRMVRIIMAARGRETFWFLYGADIRGIGMYTTPLTSRALLDAYESSGKPDHLRFGYAGTLAIWSCVDAQGRGMNTRCRQINAPDPRSVGFNDWYSQDWYSGEQGVGLYGNLNALRAYLVEDPDFGVTGYGAEVSETFEAYTMKPWDGLRVRATLKPLGVSIETVNAAMETVTVRKDKSGITLHLGQPHKTASKGQITISGMPAGAYRMSTAATSTEIRSDGKLRLEVPLPAVATITLTA